MMVAATERAGGDFCRKQGQGYLLVLRGFPFCLLISALCLIFILFSAALLGFPVGRDEAVRQRQSSWAGVAAKIQRGQAGSGQTHKTSGGRGTSLQACQGHQGL